MAHKDDLAPLRRPVNGHRRADRLAVVFSDVEMGAGGPFDDFPNSWFLGERVLSYLDPQYEHLALDVVFNGDTFDLLKTSYEGAYPRHVSREVALGKLERVAAVHGDFFAALREFLAKGGERARVHFIVGNHDMEILFPEVQRRLRALCGGTEQVCFPGYALDLGRLHVEHGSQVDPIFRMDERRPFIDHGGEQLLNLPWGAAALLDMMVPLQPLLYHHDRLKPRKYVLELMPEVKELLTSQAWGYFLKDYWRDYWKRTDPLKKVSWSMLRELVYRLASLDPNVDMGDHFQRRMARSDRYDVYVVGHLHEPAWWSNGRRRVLRTGAMRDEFMLSDGGRVQTPINKTWVEVFLAGHEVDRSQIVEVPSPLRPAGTMPASIFDVLPAVRARLPPPEARLRQRIAQRAQAAREARRVRRAAAQSRVA